MDPYHFLLEHLFCLCHRKTYWTMSMDNVGLTICLLGTPNFMITLAYFPWCKPKWSQDEFNIQPQILQILVTTSWSMMETTPMFSMFTREILTL